MYRYTHAVHIVMVYIKCNKYNSLVPYLIYTTAGSCADFRKDCVEFLRSLTGSLSVNPSLVVEVTLIAKDH